MQVRSVKNNDKLCLTDQQSQDSLGVDEFKNSFAILNNLYSILNLQH